MDQSHKKNSSEENQLDLAQIFQIIFDFKIIIISIISLSIGWAIYIAQSKPILFKSIALLEIGHYYDAEGKRKDVANIHELIDDLKSEFNYRRKGDLDIFAREQKILQIETQTSSKNDNTLVQELINLTKERHQNIIQNHHQDIQKSLEYSISFLKNEINLIENSLIAKIDGISDENIRIKYELDYDHKIYRLVNNLIPLETKKKINSRFI